MTALIAAAVGLACLTCLTWVVAFRRGVRVGRKQGRESGYHAAIDDGWAKFNDRKREGL